MLDFSTLLQVAFPLFFSILLLWLSSIAMLETRKTTPFLPFSTIAMLVGLRSAFTFYGVEAVALESIIQLGIFSVLIWIVVAKKKNL